MTLAIDNRRVAHLLLAGLLLLAVIGPACLVQVSVASAMEMDGAKSDCDGDSGRSLAACPHAHPPQSLAPAPAGEPALVADVALVAAATLPPLEATRAPAGGFSAPVSPGPLITPLLN